MFGILGRKACGSQERSSEFVKEGFGRGNNFTWAWKDRAGVSEEQRGEEACRMGLVSSQGEVKAGG